MQIDQINLDWNKVLHFTRAGFDDFCDYIPIVSTINVIVDGFQKLYWKRKGTLNSPPLNLYQKRISKKHKDSMIGLAIPGINIVVALARDIKALRTPKTKEDNIQNLNEEVGDDSVSEQVEEDVCSSRDNLEERSESDQVFVEADVNQISNEEVGDESVSEQVDEDVRSSPDNAEEISEGDQVSIESDVNQISNEEVGDDSVSEQVDDNIPSNVQPPSFLDSINKDMVIQRYQQILSQIFVNIPRIYSIQALEKVLIEQFWLIRSGLAIEGANALNDLSLNEEHINNLQIVNNSLKFFHYQKLLQKYNNEIPVNEYNKFVEANRIGDILCFVNLLIKNNQELSDKRKDLRELLRKVNNDELAEPEDVKFQVILQLFWMTSLKRGKVDILYSKLVNEIVKNPFCEHFDI